MLLSQDQRMRSISCRNQHCDTWGGTTITLRIERSLPGNLPPNLEGLAAAFEVREMGRPPQKYRNVPN